MSIKIFYAHSTRNEQVNDAYEKVTKYIEKTYPNIKFIGPQNKTDASDINEEIYKTIREADLFIADYTPDNVLKDSKPIPIFNPHVMIEIGYALNHHDLENMLLFYNKDQHNTKDSDIPIFLKTNNYNSSGTTKTEIEYMCECVEKLIKQHSERLKQIYDDYDKWETYIPYGDYHYLIELLEKHMNIQINQLHFRINKTLKRFIIFIKQKYNVAKYFIDVNRKKIIDVKKQAPFDLTCNPVIYDELKHMEILFRLSLLNE